MMVDGIWFFTCSDKKTHPRSQVEKLQRAALSVCEDLAVSPPETLTFARKGCNKLPPIPAPVQKLLLRRNGLGGGPTSKLKEKEAGLSNPRGDRGRPVKLPPLEKGLKNCLKIVSSRDWSGTYHRNWTFSSTSVLCLTLWCFSPSLIKHLGTSGQSRARKPTRRLMNRRSRPAVSSFSLLLVFETDLNEEHCAS